MSGDIQSQLDRMERKLDRTCTWIHGSDDNGRNPGAKVRLDRLEQAEKRRDRTAGYAMGALFTALAAVVLGLWNRLTGGG